MISKWLFSGALLFEIGSWVAFHQQLSVAQATTLYLGAHLLSSAMLSAGIWFVFAEESCCNNSSSALA